MTRFQLTFEPVWHFLKSLWDWLLIDAQLEMYFWKVKKPWLTPQASHALPNVYQICWEQATPFKFIVALTLQGMVAGGRDAESEHNTLSK